MTTEARKDALNEIQETVNVYWSYENDEGHVFSDFSSQKEAQDEADADFETYCINDEETEEVSETIKLHKYCFDDNDKVIILKTVKSGVEYDGTAKSMEAEHGTMHNI